MNELEEIPRFYIDRTAYCRSDYCDFDEPAIPRIPFGFLSPLFHIQPDSLDIILGGNPVKRFGGNEAAHLSP